MVGRLVPIAFVVASACGRFDFDARALDDGGGGTGLTIVYPARIDAVLNQSVIAVVPVVTGTAQRFSITPALPTGVLLDVSSGAIAGAPSMVADDVTYTVTATSASATASATFRLTALPGFVVDSTADTADDAVGDAICHSTAGNGCTLRAAVQTTNQLTTKQLIMLAAQSYLILSPLDPITNDVVIAGRSAASTILHPGTVHPGYGPLALASAHTLALRNLSAQDFGMVNGGVVAVTAGTLDVDACVFTNNTSAGSGGVLFVNNGAHATFDHTTFTANSSFGGCCSGWGGVIDGEGNGTMIVVRHSTATQNTTAWGAFSHITTGTTLLLENSTLYGNVSTIAGTLATPGGIYTLVNDTIVYNTNTNSTPDSAGIYLYSAPCAYTVTNTIVAFNRDTVNGLEQNCHRRDLSTVITSNGGNILSDDAGNCAMYFNAAGDVTSTDPGVEATPPADHGGSTSTILLVPSSVAIDSAQTAACPANDQRGSPRPVAKRSTTALCDVGAVEMQ
jgi:CSLREA domain-containing protein